MLSVCQTSIIYYYLYTIIHIYNIQCTDFFNTLQLLLFCYWPHYLQMHLMCAAMKIYGIIVLCFIGGYFLGCHTQCLNAFNRTHINTRLPATLTKLHGLAGFTNSTNLFPSFNGLCQFPIDVNQSISISISILMLLLSVYCILYIWIIINYGSLGYVKHGLIYKNIIII